MPLCQYCRHLNPVGVERCVKCQRWIGLGPEPAAVAAPATAAAPPPAVEEPVDVSPTADAPDRFQPIRDVLQRDGKIAAIKFYREQTGVGLAEAKAAVEAIEAGQSISRSASKDDEKLLGLLRAGRKIEAIKLHREQTGKGLKDAKDYVDDLGRRHGIQASAGCGTAALVMVLLIAALVVTVCYLAAVGMA